MQKPLILNKNHIKLYLLQIQSDNKITHKIFTPDTTIHSHSAVKISALISNNTANNNILIQYSNSIINNYYPSNLYTTPISYSTNNSHYNINTHNTFTFYHNTNNIKQYFTITYKT